MPHYFSLQYSAIQKTVLRHDRLWSVAGISNILSRMNELEMPRIAEQCGGRAIVAGGGKFTGRFPSKEQAERARRECVRLVATTLPMLEFQVSDIGEGATFQALKGEGDRNPLIEEQNRQKAAFRGYAVSFNPHLKLCEECGEYPVQAKIRRSKEVTEVCRVCQAAFEESRRISAGRGGETTLEKVYGGYKKLVAAAAQKDPAADFKDLFPHKNGESASDERRRMAVWFSDLNNMNDKVPVWLKQGNEDRVLETFSTFRETVIEITVRALVETFPDSKGEFLPFRLVVAGGDDLCLVMAEKDVLAFAGNLSAALNKIKAALPDNNPLTDAWLKNNGYEGEEAPKPFGFGAAFVVTSIHTPFSRIHRLGEELMSEAKVKTDRRGNGIHWRIMAEDESGTEHGLTFERPLFIEDQDQEKNPDQLSSLSFNQYLKLREDNRKKLSTSHLQQIVAILEEERGRPDPVERRMKLLDASQRDKSFSFLLRDSRDSVFRDGNTLLPQRIATFLELLTIAAEPEDQP